MRGKEKVLLKLCVKHLEQSLRVKDRLVFDRKFNAGTVILPEEVYFQVLNSLDGVANVTKILKDRS